MRRYVLQHRLPGCHHVCRHPIQWRKDTETDIRSYAQRHHLRTLHRVQSQSGFRRRRYYRTTEVVLVKEIKPADLRYSGYRRC
jgi:hypothetical protein